MEQVVATMYVLLQANHNGTLCRDHVRAASGPPSWNKLSRPRTCCFRSTIMEQVVATMYVLLPANHHGTLCRDHVRAASGPPSWNKLSRPRKCCIRSTIVEQVVATMYVLLLSTIIKHFVATTYVLLLVHHHGTSCRDHVRAASGQPPRNRLSRPRTCCFRSTIMEQAATN